MAKINISLPDELLEEIDSLATELQRSRSGLVQEATASYVTHVRTERALEERRARIDRAIESARATAATVEPFDSTAAIRADRDRDGRKAGQP
ncbi:MAG: ribbon-helix-helix protein, CopG family [Coriobacteriia bacterium]|nr:ribbon-helix-helix protein, CopG family [Coriobacteriia bacterium]